MAEISEDFFRTIEATEVSKLNFTKVLIRVLNSENLEEDVGRLRSIMKKKYSAIREILSEGQGDNLFKNVIKEVKFVAKPNYTYYLLFLLEKGAPAEYIEMLCDEMVKDYKLSPPTLDLSGIQDYLATSRPNYIRAVMVILFSTDQFLSEREPYLQMVLQDMEKKLPK